MTGAGNWRKFFAVPSAAALSYRILQVFAEIVSTGKVSSLTIDMIDAAFRRTEDDDRSAEIRGDEGVLHPRGR